MEYTQGKWGVNDSGEYIFVEGEEGEHIICLCHEPAWNESYPIGEALANAQLIAAAPHMHKALSALVAQFRCIDKLYSKDLSAIEDAEQALTEAEGK